MSSIQDPENPQPRGGDGPNRDDIASADSASGSSAEHRQDEGRGEQGGGEGGGRPGGEGPKSSSKGINPVQHSE